MRLRHPDSVLPARDHVGGVPVPVLLEAAANETRHLHVVFDHQNAHRSILIVNA
jgi:hypothetical protein